MVVPTVVVATIVEPIDDGMELSHYDLGDHGRNEHAHEYARADQISAVVSIFVRVQHRHGHGVAAGLADRCRDDLDDPEAERDFRNLA